LADLLRKESRSGSGRRSRRRPSVRHNYFLVLAQPPVLVELFSDRVVVAQLERAFRFDEFREGVLLIVILVVFAAVV